MEMTIAEIADRYSICLLKQERTDLNVDNELAYYKEELDQFPDVWLAVTMLYVVNGSIWDLEFDIRRGKEEELGLEEVGRRAIKIREFNKERITIKNQINEKYNQGFKELKKDHASE